MPCRMRNYAEALATYPCSNVFRSGRNLFDGGRGTRRIAVGDSGIGGASGRRPRIDRHLESNSCSFVHSGSRSSMEARILGIRVKFQFRQPAEIYPGSSFKIIDDDRDTSSRRSDPTGEFASWRTSTAKIIRRTIGSLEHSLSTTTDRTSTNSPGLGLLIQVGKRDR